MESEFIKINEEGSSDEGEEEKEEERSNENDNKGSTGEGANDASNLNEKQGENEATASKSLNDYSDNVIPKDQPRVQAPVSPDPPPPPKKPTFYHTRSTIYVGEYSTLIGARKVYLALARNTDPTFNKKIGVLNFASAKKPGGGFINGSQGQVRFIKFPYLFYD